MNKSSLVIGLKIKITICICIISGSIFCLPRFFSPLLAKAAKTTALQSQKQKNSTDNIQNLKDWRQRSYTADGLMDNKQYIQAEIILNNLLPQAKLEEPNGLDYALALCRLGSDLYALKKYPQALAKLDEAMKILVHSPPSVRQRKMLWRCMGTKVAILVRLQKCVEAESLARKTVAYTIAFPDIATSKQLKIVYLLLYDSLVMQKKMDDAKKIETVMNSL